MNKPDLVLNTQWLICQKIKPNQKENFCRKATQLL